MELLLLAQVIMCKKALHARVCFKRIVSIDGLSLLFISMVCIYVFQQIGVGGFALTKIFLDWKVVKESFH